MLAHGTLQKFGLRLISSSSLLKPVPSPSVLALGAFSLNLWKSIIIFFLDNLNFLGLSNFLYDNGIFCILVSVAS